jgi:CDP-glycerol glycerophosphotransferase (TagB/SpsB family)
MKINFIATEMTFLRYFLPIIIECGKRGVGAILFLGKNKKYNNPYNHIDTIKKMSTQYGFMLEDIGKIGDNKNPSILVEGCGVESIPCGVHKMVLTYIRDFSHLYNDYVDKVNSIVLPSIFFAEHYGTLSPKNLYFGSPKYDVAFNKEEILEKYGVGKGKNALVIYPHPKFNGGVKLDRLYDFLHKMEYRVIVKARGKEQANKSLRGDKYFEDFSWFPHDTMELIEISDIVINFDSTCIKECVMLDKPMVNFHVKPFSRFSFFYKYDYVDVLDVNCGFDIFSNSVNKLVGKNLSEEFEKARKNHLFPKGSNVSAKILDYLENEQC